MKRSLLTSSDGAKNNKKKEKSHPLPFRLWAAEPLRVLTWGLGGHHGGRGRDVGLVVGWRGKGGVDAPSGAPHGLRLRLQLIHQRVHHVDAHWRGRVVILVDGASTGVLVAVHEHIQESLVRRGKERGEKQAEHKAAILSILYPLCFLFFYFTNSTCTICPSCTGTLLFLVTPSPLALHIYGKTFCF